MEIIVHRVNKIKELLKLNRQYGVEVDLRSFGSDIVLNHEPYLNGDNFHNYIENYKHGTLVANIKESGIENEVVKIIKRNKNIKKFFLLDVETPYLFECLKKNKKHCAIRVSYYEPLNQQIKFKSIFNWFWVDSIKKLNLSNEDINILNKNKVCFVCPERWSNPQLIKYYKKFFKKNKIEINSVMTSLKHIKDWI
jgi:glutaredoxin-related protein